MTDAVRVREAITDELANVLGVLDAGALETDADRVRASIERGETLIAVRESAPGDDTTVLGALVLDGEEIAAVAVRRRRRGQGIGRALVGAAADRRERLVAEFDAGVRPFYEALGFEIRAIDGSERFRGRREGDGT